MSVHCHDRPRGHRIKSMLLSVFLTVPLFAGCSSGQTEANSPAVDNTRTASGTSANPQTQRPRLNNTQKTLITLAGAAALYYIYNQHRHNQQQAGAEGQYYLSKNGRVYYRDAQHRVHWVSPPSQGIQVPAEEAQQYRDFQGYNNRSTGRDLTSLPEAQSATY